jgi:hypothetical protein
MSIDITKYIGRTIASVEMTEEILTIGFADGACIKIFDDGQCCCEARYMHTDDDISSLVGHKLTGISEKDGPIEDDEDHNGLIETSETCFVNINTDDGFITIVNYNEHNGYYGGFSLEIEEIT